jgi:NADH-quinone oxidoreductase subunit H
LPKQITTFEDFIKHILWLVFWVLLLLVLVGLPVCYFLYAGLGINIIDFLALATTKPQQFIQFQLNLINTEPIKSLFQWAVFPGFTFVALFSTILMGYVERKITAKIQLRVGPQYAGKYEGVLQMFADTFKLVFKEISIPYTADTAIFIGVPFALMGVAGALIALIPLGPNTYMANPSVGVVFVFGILAFSPLIVLLAGWASNNKYSLIGGLRALHQMVAYEIPMLLSIVGIVLMAGTLNLIGVVNAQSGIWFIILQPLGAFVFFIGALAELERIPFDIPEADTELVAGWQTEYTGMMYGIFFLVNYIRMYALAALFTVFFLGGWMGIGPIPPEVWFILKTFIVMIVMMFPRAVMPRTRIDLLLRAGWARLMLLAFLNIFLAMLLLSFGVVHPGGI